MNQLDMSKVAFVVDAVESLSLSRGSGSNGPFKILGGQLRVILAIFAERGGGLDTLAGVRNFARLRGCSLGAVASDG